MNFYPFVLRGNIRVYGQNVFKLFFLYYHYLFLQLFLSSLFCSCHLYWSFSFGSGRFLWDFLSPDAA